MTSREETLRTMSCPECGRVASVPDWCARPICVHATVSNVPEVWDGDDTDGEGQPIEQAPHKPFRTPGPHSWTAMIPARVVKKRWWHRGD